MKIFVCNKYDMEKKELETPEFFDDDKFFISIKNSSDNNFPFSYNERNVLKITFDNYTDISQVEDQENNNYIFFNKKIANIIFNFVNQLNPKKLLYINCDEGIARGGAIGLVVNEYLNKFLINNIDDYNFFFKINKQIKPNKDIVDILVNKFFQGFDNIQLPEY